MVNHKIAEFNLKRPRAEYDVTQNFHKQLKLLDQFGYGLSSSAVMQLLNISKRALTRWEKQQLIFPLKVKNVVNNHIKKKFRYKDVLRCVTIKFLMYKYKLREFKTIRLFLEMANLAIYSAMESPKSINNIRIDKFLMRTLNYNVEQIATEYCGRKKSKRGLEIIVDSDEDEFEESPSEPEIVENQEEKGQENDSIK